MNKENIILHMPFDEPEDSQIAYDYSNSRADGQVNGATFVQGKIGKAIKFHGVDTCEVVKNVIPSLNGDFTIAFWVKNGKIEAGSPKNLVWLLSFADESYTEIPISARPDTWYSVSISKQGNAYSFYANSSLIKTETNTASLVGLSLNQDYYGGEYGIGLLDDVKIYNKALTPSEISIESAKNKPVLYTIDGVDFKKYGVYVSDSQGVVGRPKLKAPAIISWDNYHGESVDLMHKFYEPREIVLSCFIKAENKGEFTVSMMRFAQLFDKKGTHRLMLDVGSVKPLVYEVYCADEIGVVKKWSDDLMVGTFDLKLIEPEPVKRVLRHVRISTATKKCTITLSSSKYVNVFWGDGNADFDIQGDNVSISHDYEANGEYFVIITGDIDAITEFSTNAIIVWSKL